MNITRIAFATVGSFVAYFVFGGVVFALVPSMKDEFAKYPAIYRDHDSIMKVMPAGMAAMFVALATLSVLYSMVYKGGSGVAEGARFGVLIGLFAVTSFVIHNWVNLNIGLRLTAIQSVVYFVQWVLMGVVIGLIYKPAILSAK
jgi:hypothetical protein